MQPYAELFAYGQLSPIRNPKYTRFRDTFKPLEPEDFIEVAGRWDYGEKNALKLGQKAKMRVPRQTGEGTDPETGEPVTVVISEEVEVPIIQKYLAMGHESMIEISWAAFFIECSRVVSHEVVRHRLASYQQESQRFVKYDEEDPEDLFYIDPAITGVARSYLLEQCTNALDVYSDLREKQVAPQLARYVLPNATRTRIIMATNVREYRHILRLRMDKSAQPEMQVIANMMYEQLVEVFPNALHGMLEGGRGAR